MTDITSSCTMVRGIPQLNATALVIETPATAATGDEIDVAAYMKTVQIVYCADASGAVKVATFSGTVITLGTITTGVHFLLVMGVN